MATTTCISEKTLSWAWRSQCLERDRLFTTDGRPLQVVYPGRLNTEDGPDYAGAIIVLGDDRLLEGDVELHLRSSDWSAHGHHRDQRYNRVVLHAVLYDDLASPVVRADGWGVPALELGEALAGTPEELSLWAGLEEPPTQSCLELVARLGRERVVGVLDDAGERRFELRADRFAEELEDTPAGQVLYAGIMEALGYSRNREPFRRLAGLMPLSVLEGYVAGEHRLARLQALLLGVAGWLPDSSPLHKVWRDLGGAPLMEKTEWRLFRVRPENHPARRLAAAAHLVDRWLERGLVEGLLALVPQGWQPLEDGLMVVAPSGRGSPQTLLGRARAREIAVNVILPFARAYARRHGRIELSRQAGKLYRGYPPLEDNRVTRDMTRKLTGKETCAGWRTACRQQGLIHLQRTCCDRFRCSRCPLVAGIGATTRGDFTNSPRTPSNF